MFRLFSKGRRTVYKWILAAFLSVMALGMVITLTPLGGGDTTQTEANVLASVDGANVTAQDLRQSIDSRLRNSPMGYNAQIVPRIAANVLDQMVLERAMARQARNLGIQIAPQELLQALQAIPWLYDNGKFVGMDAYQNQIQAQTGLTVAQFEAQIRQQLLMDKVRDVVTDAVTVTPAEVHEEFVRRNARAKIEYAVFDPSQFLKAVEITPGDLEAFFKKSPERYQEPQQRRVRYALIDPDRVRAAVKIDEATLRQYYGQHLSDYRVPDRVKVAHILFKTNGKTPAETATIEKTAQDVLAQIKSGADFAELAKKYSEDTSAQNGGEIGWIVRKQTVPEFEDAAFSMKPGDVRLVKTTYGVHILKVEDKQNAHLQSFNEVQDAIRNELEKQKLTAAEESLADRLARQAKAKKDLQAAARELGLEARESPLFKFNQSIPDFGNSEAFQNLAFQLPQGDVGGPVSVPKGLAVIQVAQVVPEHVPTLDEVRARVEQDYRAERSKVLASEKAKAFAAEVKGGDFEKIAKREHVAVKESKDFNAQESVSQENDPEAIPASAVAAAFTLAPGQTSDVVTVGANSVVFRVLSHTPPKEADFAAQQGAIAEEVLERKRSVAFEIFQQNLKRRLLDSRELKMNDDAMKQFLASYAR
jgi:peptidyl-prolyl cis-trans isomerase D